MSHNSTPLQQILDQSLLPLYYWPDVEVCLQVLKALYHAGVRVVEFTNRGEKALENFRYLKAQSHQQFPGLFLGTGTIKSPEEAEAFLDAGADFLVSPVVLPGVAAVAKTAGKIWIPGAMTPTEIVVAQQLGAPLIKIFPANIVGPAFISSVRELFPGQRFIPTGGVERNKENLTTWFKAGVSAVGLGSKLITAHVLENGDYETLAQNTMVVLKTIQEVKAAVAAH
ncbi:2-dehydro-3-deoxyphosphogluconate aldolase / (4S)-4-hydroxy-2-oxoglutarate aldolase [Chitinophaga costaii]|uniref:2-dehydro-3-deoxyphosphogluconate aldolase / (4S)-4-hydroxy-2-oxoglutarate aldolase n=1 Tax=Chitinophaga costaii TaxID=1335309 RepID=A0A1C4FAJ8_9BACT|nr:bifunctional 4-hydroxy-2-oxoglutarate aldolase/2-dehydro-3-deoxy-phosphogluconate aldolase [Chitinophaga costaii]PUZ20725.1 bifunctional 4-hydroxy-2-oxoglutarate aldolase/2-dehydro-3-deoxy-phosphogluconate aldolase [Chitinophaga costaii]SCC53038.1 2-dehydro-3-deoxyphosphogluconate aldolase / (4S)-4-hydroxy-2-oxoglutarate aldolase [Chitinophaga costaii]